MWKQWRIAFKQAYPHLQARHFYWHKIRTWYRDGWSLDRALREYDL
jgi:hypothetical protein